MRYFILLSILLSGYVFTVDRLGAEEVPNEGVEILIEGKRYRSSHDYQRGKLKDALSNYLSESILHDFNDDEILDVITEIRQSHQAGKSVSHPPEAATHDVADPSLTLPPDVTANPEPDGSEMQKMLKQYRQEHAEADTVTINPEKVKDIFIQPKHKLEHSKE